jgi:hypothetical protein
MNIYLNRQLIACFAVFFLVLTVIGCGSAKPTSQPTIPAITKPEPTPTIQSAFTATLRPSKTPTPSAAIDLTRVAINAYLAPSETAERLSMDMTQDAVSSLNAAFPEACGSLYPSASPDGNWLADDCGEFHVVSRDGRKKITISHKDVSPPDSEVYLLIPHSWSKDSRYLYFSLRFCCADTDAYGWAGSLYRLDISSSTWVKMIDGYPFNYYSFSPTGRRLLHIPNDQAGSGKPVKFHILDLKSGSEQWLYLEDFEQAGSVQWSPDGMSFATTAQIGNIYDENSQYALFWVSINDSSIARLIPLSKHDVYATDWFSDDVLAINDCYYDGQVETCKSLFYNTKLQRFITASPTP